MNPHIKRLIQASGQAGDAFIVATGGTITTDGDFKVHTFSAGGTFEITEGAGDVQYLIVAGGGSSGHGSGSYQAGGGAGGMLEDTIIGMTVSTNTVVIGAGGAGGSSNEQGDPGGDSSFAGFTAAATG